ncbi:hypothetical protein Ahy_B03g062904 [Arachis hypogaea]|uniref:F-box domain-containing protein n=2 Tax=Arachis hypogaea TaxID=3818 RepID=A0A444ZVV9_ARAHY|nr:hypothetical protein Ahy_B03g062904 [Arachis hypogaea]
MSDKWVELVGCSSERLPGNLVLEILWRVPATGLVHLKRVCRSWRTLISSPEFAREHLKRSTAGLLASDARIAYASQFSHLRRIGFLPLHSLFHNPSSPAAKVVSCYDIVGSCHGLLCLFDTVSKSRVMLWNPCTGFTSKWRQTSAPIMSCGFGYDHVNGKYKFLAVVKNEYGALVSKIFTFGVNHWNRILGGSLIYSVTELKGLFVSGTFNWLVSRPRGSVILYLDLGRETYGELSLPERDPDDNIRIIPVIGVLRNCLSVCFDHKKTHWAVWLRNNRSWTQFAMIPHHPQITNRFGVASLRILYVSDDDVLLLEKGQNAGLFLYYLNDGRIAFPMIHSFSDDFVGMPMSKQIGPTTLLVYYPSLLSPIHL